MTSIVIFTGSELRHTFCRKGIAISDKIEAKNSFCEGMENLLDESSCAFSFNVETRDMSPRELLDKKPNLSRDDCYPFPFGSCNVSA
jgi:hypothetical protein